MKLLLSALIFSVSFQLLVTSQSCNIKISGANTKTKTKTKTHRGKAVRGVDVGILPVECDRGDTISIDQLDGTIKKFTKTSTKQSKYDTNNKILPAKVASYWSGDDPTDGSSLNFIRGDNGEITGSLVDMTENTITHISMDAQGSQIAVTTPASDFPDEADPLVGDGDAVSIPQLKTHSNTKLLRGVTPQIKQQQQQQQQQSKLQAVKTIIDVMVVWTKVAECANSYLADDCTPTAQTTTNMQSRIALALTETNDAYELSGIEITLFLVHSYLDPDYTEVSFPETLNAITDKTDGQMDDIHAKRTQYGADVVAIIIDDLKYCGMAYLGPNSPYMFSVTAWHCATGYYSFGHEIAHNMGANHDRGTNDACSSTATNYGYRHTNGEFRTILAYSCRSDQCDGIVLGGSCNRIKRFSTPDTTYTWFGEALSLNGAYASNNAQQHNIKAVEVSEYFTRPVSPPTSIPTEEEGENCSGVQDYNKKKKYDKNDEVKYDNKLYKSRRNKNKGKMSKSQFWALKGKCEVAAPSEITTKAPTSPEEGVDCSGVQDYKKNKKYGKNNNEVKFGNKLYKSRRNNNRRKNPATDAKWWALKGTCAVDKSPCDSEKAWKSNKTYRKKQQVVFKGALYSAKKNSKNKNPWDYGSVWKEVADC